MQVSDLLLYAVLLGAVMLFNILKQVLSRRPGEPREQPPAAAADQPMPLPSETEEFWGRVPATLPLQPALDELPAPQTLKPARPPALPAARRGETAREAAAALTGSPRGLRQAMVALALLGPCRASSPYEEPGRSP